MIGRVLFAVFCLYALPASAQQPKVDSIRKVLGRQDLSARDRAKALKNMAMYFETVDQDSSARYYTEAIRYAAANKLDRETANAYQNMSFLLTAMGNYDQAIHVLDSALFYLNRSNDPQKKLAIATVYQTLDGNYRYKNDYKSAAKYGLLATGQFEELKDWSSAVKGWYNLATLYKTTKEFDKQLDCGKKALVAAERSGQRDDKFIAYVTEAFAYNNLDQYPMGAAARDSALRYYDSAYEVMVLISFHMTSGNTSANLHDYEKAKAEYSRSLELSRQARHVFSILQSSMQLARVLTLQKHFREAERLLDSAAVQIAKTGELVQRSTLLDHYALLYEEQGNYKKALEFYKRAQALTDSLTSVENKNYITELDTRYEAGRKEARIENLETERKLQELTIRQKSNLNYLLGGLAAIVLILFAMAYKNYRQKQRLQKQRISELETEKQLTATEAVLKGEELERTRLAKDLHDGLGGMLSGIKYSLDTVKRNSIMTPENELAFERSIDMLDSSIQEMRRVAHNMMPESLMRFGIDTALREFCNDMTSTGALTVSYQSIGLQGEAMDQTTAIAIYRIVQELVNNIIKHAGAESAIVQVSKKNNQLSITVEDDGKGFDVDAPVTGRGIGWSNIRNRVELLKGKLDIKSLPGNGTSVLIEFNS